MTMTSYEKEFSSGIKLVHWVVNRRILREEHRDHENVRAEALVLAWTEYPKLRVRFPDRPIPKVLALAARFGSWRARRGMKLVKTREKGYVDALDGAKALGAVDRPDRPENKPVAVEDRTRVEQMLDMVPQEHRGFCRVLSYGVSKVTVAERFNCSVRTVQYRCEELRPTLAKIVAAMPAMPELPVFPDDEPVNRFVPAAQQHVAIPVVEEHNRCVRLDVVTHIDPWLGHVVLEDRS